MKARAHSLLTGKLGSLVRSKPPLPPSAVAKPPLPPSAGIMKPSRPISAPVTRSPQRTPLSPTGLPSGHQREEKIGGSAPVIKPYLVKKGEENTAPQGKLIEVSKDEYCL